MSANQITIGQQREIIAALAGAVTGITKAFPRWPRSLESRELPAAVVHLVDAEHDQAGGGSESLIVRRQGQLYVFVKTALEGREYEAEEAVEALIDPVIEALAARTTVILTDGRTFDLALRSDTAVKPLTFSGQTYAGFIVRFVVETGTYIERDETPPPGW